MRGHFRYSAPPTAASPSGDSGSAARRAGAVASERRTMGGKREKRCGWFSNRGCSCGVLKVGWRCALRREEAVGMAIPPADAGIRRF